MADDDFLPTASWPMLRRRAEMLRRVRSFFDARGFLEVETPILSVDTVIDRRLDPFVVAPEHNRSLQRARYLQTSPEFAMKRLMAAGGEAIYQITHAFRQEESGQRHNPEFTLVEWYRRGDDLERGMQLLSDLAEEMLERGPADRLSYREAFQRYADVDPLTDDIGQLKAACTAHSIAWPESFEGEDRDAWLDLLLVELVEPQLGRQRPAILYGYPPSQAALAVVRGDPPVAERFELYDRGVELANGYHELLDAETLRKRNATNNALRAADGKRRLPEESRLLRAMEHGLPPCAGVALGFDRLVMLAVGAEHISEVIPFPFHRA